jgi:hypothetical protein
VKQKRSFSSPYTKAGSAEQHEVGGIRVANRREDSEDGYEMPRLKIADLLANAPTDPESHLDPARVQRYARMLDALPPVVVFDTPEGPLLADGYHRLAVVRQRGLETVEAEVHAGSRREALRYAVEVGGAQRGISPEEAASHIQRHATGGRASEKNPTKHFRE